MINIILFFLYDGGKKTNYILTLAPNPSALGKTEDVCVGSACASTTARVFLLEYRSRSFVSKLEQTVWAFQEKARFLLVKFLRRGWSCSTNLVGCGSYIYSRWELKREGT